MLSGTMHAWKKLLSHAPLRHTYTTRMVYTVVPSQNYAGKSGATLEALMDALATDCNKLYTSGIEASGCSSAALCCNMWSMRSPSTAFMTFYASPEVHFEGQSFKVHFRYLGSKGDWPWLRSVFRLETGFTSRRVCHICPSREPGLQGA